MPELSGPAGIAPPAPVNQIKEIDARLNVPIGVKNPSPVNLKSTSQELETPSNIQFISKPALNINNLIVVGLLLLTLMIILFAFFRRRLK